MQDGSAHNLFIREIGKAPVLGESVNPSTSEKNRFFVYAEDFVGHDSQLFLTEMNRGKNMKKNLSYCFLKRLLIGL